MTRLQTTEFFQALASLHAFDRRTARLEAKKSGETPPVSCSRGAVLDIPLSAYKKHAARLEEGFRKIGRFLFGQHIYWFKDVPYPSQPEDSSHVANDDLSRQASRPLPDRDCGRDARQQAPPRWRRWTRWREVGRGCCSQEWWLRRQA